MCAHHLSGDSTGLVCTRTDEHQAGHGCVFVSTSVDDLHTASEQKAEAER